VGTVIALEVVLGGGAIDRHLHDAVALLRGYREDEGTRYLNQVPITSPDRLVPEDLAVTMLINSRVGLRAYKSVQDLAPALDVSVLPTTPLEEATAEQRALVADVVARVAHWPGFAASVASKVLHKKRACRRGTDLGDTRTTIDPRLGTYAYEPLRDRYPDGSLRART
jgi:hypothetical protein